MRIWKWLGVLAFGVIPASGAVGQTWDGGSGASNSWSDGANWSANSAPNNNGSANVNFAGNVRLSPVVDVSYNVNSVSFDNAAAAFNIASAGAAVLTIRGGGVTNNNAVTGQTISVATSVGAAQTWGGVGNLTFGGPIGLNSNVLTVNTPAVVTLNNSVSGGGSIVKNGVGALVLNGNSSFAGGVTLNDGTLAIGLNAGLGAGVLTINGGKLEGTGGARALENSVVINNDFAVPSGTAVEFEGPVTLTGAHTLTNSITNLSISGAIGRSAADGELTLAGSGNLTLKDAALTLGTSLRHTAGTLTATGLITTPGNMLTQSGGTFAGTLINRGSFVFNGGTHSGNITNEAGGDATFNANFTFAANVNNLGTMRVANSKTLTFGSKSLNNVGTIELLGGTVSGNGSTTFANAGLVSGYGSISATDTGFRNSGEISVSGGNLTVTSNFHFNNTGTINVATGRQLIWNSTAAIINAGLTQLAGGSISGTGKLWNNAGGEIRGGGFVQSEFANIGGVVRATAGSPLTIVNLAGGNTTGSELRVDENATLNVQSTFTSSGTIVLSGPNATLNLNSVTNSGTVRGQGRVTGAVLNSGVVRAETGTLTFASVGNTNAIGGRIEAGVGGQLLYTQGLASNAGIVALTGGGLDNNNLPLANPGRIEGYGTLRTGGLTNSGTIAVGGTMDVLGSVTNSGTVNTSPGSQTRFFGAVTGAGSFTGTGTVTFLNTFAPGASPAAVSFGGDLALSGGSILAIELGGTTPGSQYDTVSTAGSASIGGALDLSTINGFVPTVGSVYQILSATQGVLGKFNTASLPVIEGASWQLRYESNAVFLQLAIAGDVNFDGVVNAADYSLWRDTLGQSGAALAGDVNGNGQVDSADYNLWKTNYGATVGGAGGIGRPDVTAVPEPATVVLFTYLLAGIALGRKRS
jgi:fibronectin-binding autotransporter adhesin